jgi:hypothetical protein
MKIVQQGFKLLAIYGLGIENFKSLPGDLLAIFEL